MLNVPWHTSPSMEQRHPAWPRRHTSDSYIFLPCNGQLLRVPLGSHNGKRDLKKHSTAVHGRKRTTKGPMAGLSFGSCHDKGTVIYKSDGRFPALPNTPTGLRLFSSLSPLSTIPFLPLSVPYRAFRQSTAPLPFGLFAARSLTRSSFPSLTPPTLDRFLNHAQLCYPHDLARRRYLRCSSRICCRCRCRRGDPAWVGSFLRPVSATPFQSSPEFVN